MLDAPEARGSPSAARSRRRAGGSGGSGHLCLITNSAVL